MSQHTTHDLANSLRTLAEKLESKPAAEFDGAPSFSIYCHDKESFIALGRVVGGEKDATDSFFFRLKNHLGCLDTTISVCRTLVCKLVKPATPAVYDCLPLLSPEEEQALEAQ